MPGEKNCNQLKPTPSETPIITAPNQVPDQLKLPPSISFWHLFKKCFCEKIFVFLAATKNVSISHQSSLLANQSCFSGQGTFATAKPIYSLVHSHFHLSHGNRRQNRLHPSDPRQCEIESTCSFDVNPNFWLGCISKWGAQHNSIGFLPNWPFLVIFKGL